MSNVRLVIFDLGRVLVRICDDWPQACGHVAVEHPRGLSPAQVAELHAISNRFDIGAIDLANFLSSFGAILQLPPESIQRALDAYLRGPYPGGAALIDELHDAGLQTACLSNTNERHWRIMSDPSSHSPLPLDRLTYRFASHQIGARKPDASIYQHVERETMLSPSEMLFFDDVAENVTAATSRGWQAWKVDPQSLDPIAAVRAELRRRKIIPADS